MSITAIGSSNPINFNSRLSEFDCKLKQLTSFFNIKDDVKIELIDFNSSPAASPVYKTVFLPVSYLIKFDDIPLCMRITDFEDPRLFDTNFIKQMTQWLNEKFKEGDLGSVCQQIPVGSVQRILLKMLNPDLYEKTKDFSLAHEAAHLKQTLWETGGYLLAIKISGTIFLIALSIAIAPLVTLPAACASVVGTGIVIIVATKVYTIFHSRALEKRADLSAVEALQDARGGIYDFGTDLICNRMLLKSRNISQWNKWHYDSNGNYFFDFDHPSLTERVNYLKQWSNPTVRPGVSTTVPAMAH